MIKKSTPPPCTMEFGRDEFGREILLKDGRFQVMMEWEKPYMQACIDALKPSGDVLEVGFGFGYASTRIQHYKPKTHTIIEYHPVVAEKAREWAKQYSGVIIVEDTWQNALHKLGRFDTIFFDDYPLESDTEMRKMQKSSEEAHLALRAGKKKMEELEQDLAFLHGVKYSDADIDSFFMLLKTEELAEPKVFLRFFYEMLEKEHITDVQLGRALRRLIKEKYVSEKDIAHFEEQRKIAQVPTMDVRRPGDRLLEFLDLCLKNHMRKGSRFSCYLSDSVSKYEDEKFFNLIITNSFLEYHETRMDVEVPSNCRYHKGSDAIVMTITKLVD